MPEWAAEIRARLASLSIAPAREAEIVEELSQHLEDRWRDAVAAGADPEQTTAAILAELRERDLLARHLAPLRQSHWADSPAAPAARGVRRPLALLSHDVRDAWRRLRRNPGFTLAVACSLALGIGANTAIFSLLDAVMWRTLPIENPAGLWVVQPGLTFQQYRSMSDAPQLSGIAGFSTLRLNISVNGQVEPTTDGQLVSGSYFALLGVRPEIGRALGPEDDRVPNGHPVAMISDGYWQRRFDRTPSVVGQALWISGTRFTIVGVTPPEFFGVEVGTNPDVFIPLMMQPTALPAFENLVDHPIVFQTWITPLVRLNAGIDVGAATGALQAFWKQTLPPGYRGPSDGLTLQPAATGLSTLRRQFSQPLYILMSVVGVVLLIACANTANLLLARAAARGPEFATRLALGAGRWRLTRHLLVESVLLAALGGVAGIALARWGTALLIAFISSGRSPVVLDLSPNVRVLTFTAAVSMITGIMFGLAPAWRAARVDVWRGLRHLGGASARVHGGLRPVKILASAQVALSLVLLICAGLFVRSLAGKSGESFGVSRDRILVVPVQPRGSDQRNIPGTTARLDRIYRDLLERIRGIPGVRLASIGEARPTTPFWGATAGVTLPTGESERVPLVMLYAGYFASVGVPMAAGREFDEGDLAENAPAVCVVNEAFVRRVFPNENPIGRPCLRGVRPNVHDEADPRYAPDAAPEDYRIIGVVKDARYSNPQGDVRPVIYTTLLQTGTGRGEMVLYARVAGDVGRIAARIRDEVLRVDPTLPVFDVHTLAEEMDAALVRERLVALLSSLFGGLALLLACVGLYGLLAFGVVQRKSEIGIRLALGAGRGAIARMVLIEGLWLVGAGLAIGVPLALATARFAESRLSGLLFGRTTVDAFTMTGAAAVLLAVALLASFLPARRAARVDPLVAVRSE